MKITITVSDKLFWEDIEDCFQDFFSRVITDIESSLDTGSIGFCGQYELETAKFLKDVFAKGQYETEE